MGTNGVQRRAGRLTTCSGEYLLALLDRDLAFTWVNEAFARAAGRRPDGLVGQGFFAIYPNPVNEAIFRRVLETGRPFTARSGLERALRLSEHSVCWWDCELNPTRGADGKVTGLVLVLRDVTSRVPLEREPLLRPWQTGAVAAASAGAPTWPSPSPDPAVHGPGHRGPSP